MLKYKKAPDLMALDTKEITSGFLTWSSVTFNGSPKPLTYLHTLVLMK